MDIPTKEILLPQVRQITMPRGEIAQVQGVPALVVAALAMGRNTLLVTSLRDCQRWKHFHHCKRKKIYQMQVQPEVQVQPEPEVQVHPEDIILLLLLVLVTRNRP